MNLIESSPLNEFRKKRQVVYGTEDLKDDIETGFL